MEQSGTYTLAFPLFVPVLTRDRFAALCGLEAGVVRGMIDRGYLPTIKIGRHRLVNLAVLYRQCLDEYPETGAREDAAAYGRC